MADHGFEAGWEALEETAGADDATCEAMLRASDQARLGDRQELVEKIKTAIATAELLDDKAEQAWDAVADHLGMPVLKGEDG